MPKTANPRFMKRALQPQHQESHHWSKGCLVAALALHSALLLLPSPLSLSESEDIPPETDAQPLATALTVKSLPEPLPLPTVSPNPAASPSPIDSAPIPQASLPSRPVNPPTASPPSPSPQPAQSPAVSTVPTNTPDPLPSEDPPPDPPPSPSAVAPSPYAQFPHLEASSSCQGLSDCWRSPTPSWRSAMRHLREQLEAQGYELENVTETVLSNDTGVRIYAVLQDGAIAYYLNLVSVSEGILYAMTEQPMTQDSLDNLNQF